MADEVARYRPEGDDLRSTRFPHEEQHRKTSTIQDAVAERFTPARAILRYVRDEMRMTNMLLAEVTVEADITVTDEFLVTGLRNPGAANMVAERLVALIDQGGRQAFRHTINDEIRRRTMEARRALLTHPDMFSSAQIDDMLGLS